MAEINDLTGINGIVGTPIGGSSSTSSTTTVVNGKLLTIKLYISELIYDFQNKSYLTGRSRRGAGKEAEFTSFIQASNDTPDINQTLRSIQNAYSQLLLELSEGLPVSVSNVANNVLWKENGDITIELNLPPNFPFSLKDALADSIHDYIVTKALGDWFVLTNPEEADNYIALAQAAMKTVHELFNRRMRPNRKDIADELI